MSFLRRPASLAVFWLLASMSAGAQTPGGQGLFTIGSDPTASTGPQDGTDNGAPEDALEAALAFFAGGDAGEVLFLPGVHTFSRTVTIPPSARGLTLRGSKGAIIRFEGTPPTDSVLFDIQASDVTLRGLNFEDLSPASDTTLLRVTGDDFNLVGCRFHERSTVPATDVSRYTFVDIGDGLTAFDGATLDGNIFLFPNLPGSRNGTLNGITGVRARLGRNLRVYANEFRSLPVELPCGTAEQPSCSGWLDEAIHLDSIQGFSMLSNIFEALGHLNDRIETAVRVLDTIGPHESSGTITANYFENVVSENYAIHLSGGEGISITGNGLGRCSGGIQVDGVTAGGGPAEIVIAGNELHNVGLDQIGTFGILVRGRDGVAVTSNIFGLCQGGQIRFEAFSGRAHIVGNQFISKANCPNLTAAIQVDGGVDHYIAGNTAQNLGTSSWAGVLEIVNTLQFETRRNSVLARSCP